MKGLRSLSIHALAAAACAFALPAQQPVRITFIGDSITESTPTYSSYRYYLYNDLTADGYSFEFVGPNWGVFGGSPAHFFPQQAHQAFSGWRCEHQIAQMSEFVEQSNPDIALIHLGTNDCIANQPIAQTVDELAVIIDQLRGQNPDITVLVAQIIPMDVPPAQPWRDVTGLNALIPAMVASKDSLQSRVVVVDHYTPFDPNQLPDGIHPNTAGEQMMAATWLAAIKPFMTPAADEFPNFGTSCQGTAPAPIEVEQIRGQAASLGHPYTVKVRNLPIGASVFGVIGFSDTLFNGTPLPLDLTLIGAPGCSLLTGPEITEGLVNQAGYASWTLQVPDDPLLIDLVVYEQTAALQPGLNALGLVLSEAAKFTIVDKQ